MIEITGPDFKKVDNRLLSLTLVKERMTDAVIFSPDGVNHQASDILYKKNILKFLFQSPVQLEKSVLMK